MNITEILHIAMNKPPSLFHTCHETLAFVWENHFVLWWQVMFVSLVFLSLTNFSFHHLQRLEMLAPQESIFDVFITSNDYPLPNTMREMNLLHILAHVTFEAHNWTHKFHPWMENFENPNYKFSKGPRKFKKHPNILQTFSFKGLIGQLPAGPCLVTNHGMSCLCIRSPASVRCGCAYCFTPVNLPVS